MKKKEEIEKLADKWLEETPIKEWGGAENGYIEGYTQCQEDMADNKYTDEDVFVIAKKLWIDMFYNETLTYNSFEEYFKNKIKK